MIVRPYLFSGMCLALMNWNISTSDWKWTWSSLYNWPILNWTSPTLSALGRLQFPNVIQCNRAYASRAYVNIKDSFRNISVRNKVSQSSAPAIIHNNPMDLYPYNLTIVSFVNGIYYSPEDWERIGRQLEDTFDCRVRPFYNPSTGNWASDVSSATMQKLSKPNDFDLAKNLSKHLKSLLDEVGEHGRVLHIAHSGGAILTYLAAKYHLSKRDRRKLDVIAFGGGHSLTKKYFFGRLVNYYARNDPCVYVDKRALQLSRLPEIASKLALSANNSFIEVFDWKHNSSFVFLRGIIGHPIKDHSMEGPTYKSVLVKESAELTRARNEIWGALVARRNKEADRKRTVRKAFSRLTGKRHFFKRVSRLISDSFTASAEVSKEALQFARTLRNHSVMSLAVPKLNWTLVRRPGRDYWSEYIGYDTLSTR
jgi:hypothetical protein